MSMESPHKTWKPIMCVCWGVPFCFHISSHSRKTLTTSRPNGNFLSEIFRHLSLI